IADTDEVYISRIRMLDERRFVFWNVADNIRVGAATNAVKILEKHLELNRKG
ncbi:MAG TPA: aspartate-semialdehyde dehydrogenase, partial [Thermotogales bacterium]|nr:aspartate-semialdehyde dehydrogenase [Thermotogales bacterium]